MQDLAAVQHEGPGEYLVCHGARSRQLQRVEDRGTRGDAGKPQAAVLEAAWMHGDVNARLHS